MGTFQPSQNSDTPRDKAMAGLLYIRKASVVLERAIEGGVPMPGWVLSRITQCAGMMGTAVSYVSSAKKRVKK